jgi:uncharacterized LabA/DUF88 family protein
MKKESNIAFIDGQNLYYGTRESKWKIDFRKFRTYLKEKYHVDEAYYFFGYIDEAQKSLYANLQKAGFIVTFREHSSSLKGTKKGNVDTDIVFEVMRTLIENDHFSKILLISGDGDYKKMVDYLIGRGVFKKILFPDMRAASSLYKSIGRAYFDYLDKDALQSKIGYTDKKKRGP